MNASENLQKIHKTCFAFFTSRILCSAVELDVFTHINNGANTVEMLAQHLQASARGISSLLDSLTVMKYLTKQNNVYGLTEPAEMYLVKDNPYYIGPFLENVSDLWEHWASLTESIIKGGPVKDITYDAAFFQGLVRRLFVMCYPTAVRVTEVLGIGKTWTNLNVFDVAAGASPWGIAIAEADPRTKVTANDFDEVLDVVKEFAEARGVADQFDYLPGDINQLRVKNKKFDLVILGHVCHAIGAANSQSLIKHCYDLLKPNGKLLIADLICDDNRSEAEFPVLFSTNMLVLNQEGNTFTHAEYTEWLQNVGFKSVEMLTVPAISPLILAEK